MHEDSLAAPRRTNTQQARGHVELPDQEFYCTVDPDKFLVHSKLQDDPRQVARNKWAELLGRYPAHCFATLTFRPVKHWTDRKGRVHSANRTGNNGSMHPEAADKAFRYFIGKLNDEIYSQHWRKRWHGGVQWARGSEFHKDGRLHYHALISAPTDDLNRLASRYTWHEWWYREFGRNQIEQPRSQADVAGYVSKYVVKDGTVDISENFGAWQPPRPDYSVVPHQSDLSGVAHDDPGTHGL